MSRLVILRVFPEEWLWSPWNERDRVYRLDHGERVYHLELIHSTDAAQLALYDFTRPPTWTITREVFRRDAADPQEAGRRAKRRIIQILRHFEREVAVAAALKKL